MSLLKAARLLDPVALGVFVDSLVFPHRYFFGVLRPEIGEMGSMQYQYRITKYSPEFRNLSGAYLRDDWTSRADIGRQFNGILLTSDRYRIVESAYLTVASAFLAEAGISQLKVVGLENHQAFKGAPEEGAVVSSAEVLTILQSLLREEFWCKLEGSSSFLHIGYDYYMYFEVPKECVNSSALARSLGLFVETYRSPYARNEG